jgi:hypothetical protein
VHVDGQLGAVAGREVAVARGRQGLVVDVGAGRRGRGAGHRQRIGLLPAVDGAHAVAAARLDLAEQQPAEEAGLARLNGLARTVDQSHPLIRRETGHVDLLGAAMGAERRGRGSGGCAHESCEQHRSEGPHALPHLAVFNGPWTRLLPDLRA